MKKCMILALLTVILLTACGQNTPDGSIAASTPSSQNPGSTTATTQKTEATYVSITAQEAKQIMDTQTGYIILDTRTQAEYDEGHIPGAIVISHDEILEKAESVLTDKDQLILVYCRSGRRSKLAAADLVKLGYTNIKEFGGIIDWPYEVEQ